MTMKMEMINRNNLAKVDPLEFISPYLETKNDLINSYFSIFDSLDISDNTRNEYSYRIRLFLIFVREFGFTKNSYLDYKRYLANRTDFSVSTKNKYLIVARVYCREIHRQGYIPINITENVKTFQQTRKHKKEGISEAEIQKILSHLDTLANSKNIYRIKALLSLLILQGLRQIEIVRLNVSDIDFASQTAFIQGKGKDDKESVDLHPVTVAALKEYIRKNKIADGALFVSTSNNSKKQRLTTKSIRNLLNPILKSLEVDKTVHGFRHYFTTKLGLDKTTIYHHRKQLIGKGLLVEENGFTKIPNFYVFEHKWVKGLVKAPVRFLQQLIENPQRVIENLQELIEKIQQSQPQNKPQSSSVSSKSNLSSSNKDVDIDEIVREMGLEENGEVQDVD